MRRSAWPNVSEAELVRLVEEWAEREGLEARIFWEGDETADDAIVRAAEGLERYWVVSSDRELRRRAGGRAERVLGGGSFLRRLRGLG